MRTKSGSMLFYMAASSGRGRGLNDIIKNLITKGNIIKSDKLVGIS